MFARFPHFIIPARSALQSEASARCLFAFASVSPILNYVYVRITLYINLPIEGAHMKLKLHTKIFIAIVLGILAGVFLKEITPVYINPFGQIFMRLLKLLVIPVVFTSVTLGIVSIGDAKHLGSISGKAFAYFISTGFIATTMGLILVNIIKPGIGSHLSTEGLKSVVEQAQPAISELFVSMAPQNMFESLAKGDILQVIIVAILLGIALTKIGIKAKPISSFLESSFEAFMHITDWVIALTPIGVFALAANTVATLGLSSLLNVGTYFLTVLAGLIIHACIILPIVLKIFGKYSPVELFRKLVPALAIAAPTASSSSALPITMECLNKGVGVPNKITSFVVSVGTTIDMNGTALYQGVAVMFIAQMYGIHLDLFHQGLIVLTSFLASAGAAAVPGAGLVTMVIILNAVGVPIEGLALILPVDRILDSCRTPVNLWSNSIGAVIVANLEKESLRPLGKDFNPELDILEDKKEEVSTILSKDSERELEIVGRSKKFFRE